MPVSPALPRVSSCPPELTAFGRRLRKARRAREFTQRQLAGKCGLNKSYLGRVEHGLASMSIMAIHAVAAALDVPAAWLFEVGTDVPPLPEGRLRWRS